MLIIMGAYMYYLKHEHECFIRYKLTRGAAGVPLHDATCCMRLTFWRMKTTASAIISVYQLQTKFKM